MPQQPDDLSRIIREMAEKHAKLKGLSIDQEALGRIGTIPPPYSTQKEISVELSKLDIMVRDIIELAAKFARDGMIDLRAIEKGLIEVKCHYLWFC
jgi:hypothetical protein